MTRLAALALALCAAGCGGTSAPVARAVDDQWPAYAGPAGARSSPLGQVSAANVGQLQVAWTYHTGELGPGRPGNGQKLDLRSDAESLRRPALPDYGVYRPHCRARSGDRQRDLALRRRRSIAPARYKRGDFARGVGVARLRRRARSAVRAARPRRDNRTRNCLALDAAHGQPCAAGSATADAVRLAPGAGS